MKFATITFAAALSGVSAYTGDGTCSLHDADLSGKGVHLTLADAPECCPCTDYAVFVDKAATAYCQDAAGKCWSSVDCTGTSTHLCTKKTAPAATTFFFLEVGEKCPLPVATLDECKAAAKGTYVDDYGSSGTNSKPSGCSSKGAGKVWYWNARKESDAKCSTDGSSIYDCVCADAPKVADAAEAKVDLDDAAKEQRDKDWLFPSPIAPTPVSPGTEVIFHKDMFTAQCNPKECENWTCVDWCHCFESNPLVEQMFNSLAYGSTLAGMCPSDATPCEC
jgi:hypothetical protein